MAGWVLLRRLSVLRAHRCDKEDQMRRLWTGDDNALESRESDHRRNAGRHGARRSIIGLQRAGSKVMNIIRVKVARMEATSWMEAVVKKSWACAEHVPPVRHQHAARTGLNRSENWDPRTGTFGERDVELAVREDSVLLDVGADPGRVPMPCRWSQRQGGRMSNVGNCNNRSR